MSSHHLAIYNFGIHVAPYGDAAVAGFANREALNFEAARRALGFIGRSGYEGEPGPTSWGMQTFPRFLGGSGHEAGPSSLSLWQDIESLMAFSYAGVHAEALKHARKWNVPQQWPPLVLWWIAKGSRPDWSDAVRRFERLHDYGASLDAFTFKQPFDPSGEPYTVNHTRVRELVKGNTETQPDLLAAVAKIAP